MTAPGPFSYTYGRRPPPRSRRTLKLVATILLVLAAIAAASAGLVVACSGDDEDASTDGSADATGLPPLTSPPTTVSATAAPTTIPTSYEIQQGDSLFSIAEQFGIDVTALAALNGITNPDYIQAGQVLQLPQPTVATTTTLPGASPPTAVTTAATSTG